MIFDFDETLLSADSALLWFQYLVDIGADSQGYYSRAKGLMEQYYLGTMVMQEFIDLSVQALEEMSFSRVDQLASTSIYCRGFSPRAESYWRSYRPVAINY